MSENRYTEVTSDKPFSGLLGPYVEMPLEIVTDQIRADGTGGKIALASGVHPIWGVRFVFCLRDREAADRTIDMLTKLRDLLWPETTS